MTFTEVAFELADPRQPLCRMSRAPHGAYAVYRILDTGEATRRHRAHVSLHGSPEVTAEAVRELRSSRPDLAVEIAHQGPNALGAILEAPLDAPAGAGGLAVIVPVLAHHQLHPILDPIVVIEGRARVRLVIPRQADPQEVLRALQDVQRQSGFSEFRIQRIGAVTPNAHVETARRALPPEQEALLALATSMGYYETPKVVTLDEIARTVGLSISPVHKRLKAAEETIVARHVGPGGPDAPRRRSRSAHSRYDTTSPWEVQVHLRGDIGPSAFLAQHPGVRASLHVTSGDATRGQNLVLVVLAPADAQAKLLSSIEDRPEVASFTLLERSAQHVVCRMGTRDRGAYSLSWWHDAWGADATLRSLVFEGGDVHLRALVTRPATAEKLQQRLAECARVGGWSEWDLTSVRPLEARAKPPLWPEQLTQRQLEVLRVAHALGYYRTPRGCTLESVATTLGVSANAIHKNLVLAEAKLISAYLASGL